MGSPDELELIALYIGNLMTAFSVYLSVTFAYLTASYFAGSNLSRFQTAALTGLYVFAAISCVGSMIVNLSILADLQAALPENLRGTLLGSANTWNMYMASVMTIGIFVSVYFMYNVRRKSKKE